MTTTTAEQHRANFAKGHAILAAIAPPVTLVARPARDPFLNLPMFEAPKVIDLVARPARSPRDAERLRRIRNECARWMTGSNRLITPNEQAAWWASPARKRNAIWLFAPPGAPPDDAVGFGLFRMEGEQWWATLGLLPAWRGQGYGVGIYRHLIARCPGDLWIRVLLTNPGSARAAEKAGFRPVDSNGVYAELVARRGV